MPNMRSLSDIWGDSWILYSNNFKKISNLSVIFILSMFVVYGLTVLMIYGTFDTSSFSEYSPIDVLGTYSSSIYMFFIKIIVSILLIGLLTIFFNTSLMKILYQSVTGQDIELIDAIKYSKEKFWSILMTSLILMLFIFLLMLLLIVPGIIFLVFWSFTIIVIISKEIYGKAAMDYSKSIVKNRWWISLLYSITFSAVPISILKLLSFILKPLGFYGEIVYYLAWPLLLSLTYCGYVVYFVELDKTKA